MKKVNYLILLAAATLIGFSSCKEDEAKPKPQENTVTLNASAYDKWVYFSFEENAIVEISDFANSSSWDIGFHRMDVRVNGGMAGPGQGATKDMGKVEFSSITEAPESGYSENAMINILESPAMPPTYVSVPGDTLMSNKWIKMTHGAGGPSYTISDHIFIIKTADGKYAKIWLSDYFNEEGKGGHPTMKYLYQPDGSRSFE
jgi:hypothetical protein